ncbi:MAG: patatin-like phospholipase family protein [Desulfomonilia bacterium]
MRLRKKKRVVLALGAGGSRGLAHIGVIRALNDAGIPIDCIVGISFGAIVGSLYCLTRDIDEVEKKLREYMESPLFQDTWRDMEFVEPEKSRTFLEKIQATIKQGYFYTKALSRRSVITPENFVLHIKELVGEHTFDDLTLPFKCSSVDLITGNPIIFNDGDLYTALQASCAAPGFFPPVNLHGMLLVDGGVAEMIPYHAAQTFRPDYLIGVDVTQSIDPIDEDKEIHHSLDVVFRSYDITREYMNIYIADKIDSVIRPNIGSYSWADFEYFDLFVEEGYRSTMERAPGLRRKIYWVYT